MLLAKELVKKNLGNLVDSSKFEVKTHEEI